MPRTHSYLMVEVNKDPANPVWSGGWDLSNAPPALVAFINGLDAVVRSNGGVTSRIHPDKTSIGHGMLIARMADMTPSNAQVAALTNAITAYLAGVFVVIASWLAFGDYLLVPGGSGYAW